MCSGEQIFICQVLLCPTQVPMCVQLLVLVILQLVLYCSWFYIHHLFQSPHTVPSRLSESRLFEFPCLPGRCAEFDVVSMFGTEFN